MLGLLGEVTLDASDIALLKSDTSTLALESRNKVTQFKDLISGLLAATKQLESAHSELVNIVQHSDHDLVNFEFYISEFQSISNHLKIALDR